ncbi:hypothetical protein [Pseudodesulfovibrio tunisiensis]|uniref:hypothetical protein n=1 Tax=Pseudodesulfovibrio tunisiensis TaxID=463192 RepID=UPI001FB37700|nr:hypothetical protein [Pseudodesulfovibrio tunisiensis]
MTFTPAEALLSTLLVTVITAAVVRAWDARKFVTCDECKARHEADKEAVRIVYRMVRALIVHSDMPKEEKEKILNDRSVE